MSLNVNAVLQMAKIFSIPESRSILGIQKLSVEQQKGIVDCGLLSVAYSVEIHLCRNPQCASFAQEKIAQSSLCLPNQRIIYPFSKIVYPDK